MLLFQKKTKKRKRGSDTEVHGTLSRLCKHGILESMVDEYICSCHSAMSQAPDDTQKSRAKQKNRFANIAGLCRYVGSGVSDITALREDYPEEYDKLLAIFEDEALNSDVSPTLLSAYLKKRLGYAADKEQTENAKEVRYCFEHDIFADGE